MGFTLRYREVHMYRSVVAFVLAIVLVIHIPANASAARVHGWTAEKETSLRECHDRTCKRLLHIQAGETVNVTRYWDNWGYATVGDKSGWINLLAFDRATRADKMKRCYDTTFNYTVCAPDWISEAITHEAKRYGVERNLMMRIAACESDFKPTTIGAAGEIGIFQWMPGTWDSSNTVGDIHDSWNQSTNAARFISLGHGHLWTCWRRIVWGER